MRLSLIVAVAQNGVIGRDGDLPWRLPADLRFFKRTTLGHHLIMGRKTWESIGRPLPGRSTVVLTRDRDAVIAGVAVAHDLRAGLAVAEDAGDAEAFVAGGAAVYAAALPHADRLYLTEVAAVVDGDVRFPSWDEAAWSEVAREEHAADERHPHAFVIRTLDRRR
ncbi:MAG: dihydrofolate reductase [Deltaproteobacteria bacterium]|nr:dihydrofolate reductase [Deltaproteobacteria bacterium]